MPRMLLGVKIIEDNAAKTGFITLYPVFLVLLIANCENQGKKLLATIHVLCSYTAYTAALSILLRLNILGR